MLLLLFLKEKLTHAHPHQVEKLQELFPSANVTKMVSRTPGIMYLDIDRTIRPKAEWIQQAVGLDQPGLDRLVEEGEKAQSYFWYNVLLVS